VERKSGQTRFERTPRRLRRSPDSGRSGFVRCTASGRLKRRERAAMGCMGIGSAVCEGGISLAQWLHYQRFSGERKRSDVNLR
jgi:hypothetical protein